MVPAPILLFSPTSVSPIYDKWFILLFDLIFEFFVSTKFPTFEPGKKCEPGLILAYGPTVTFLSSLAPSKCEKDFIVTLSPTLTFEPITT